jgi:hypothetical protein
MENLIDLIATDASAAEISDTIKNLLYSKAAEKVEAARPIVSSAMFNDESQEGDQE